MNGFGLLIGHLVGDYLVQNDFLASNKVAWGHDAKTVWKDVTYVTSPDGDGKCLPGTPGYEDAKAADFAASRAKTRLGHLGLHDSLPALYDECLGFQFLVDALVGPGRVLPGTLAGGSFSSGWCLDAQCLGTECVRQSAAGRHGTLECDFG